MNQANGAHSFVGGGCDNVVDGACSSILGGYKNYAQGDCSVIIGGANNNDMGFAYAGIFGNSINAVMSDAFHVGNLVVPNMPASFSGNSKQLYYMPTAGPGSPCAVYIV
jgi:hypothetical protein